MRHQLSHEQLMARLAELTQAMAQRPLTPAETAERQNLEYRLDLRLLRIDRQILAARAKLQRLEAIRNGRSMS